MNIPISGSRTGAMPFQKYKSFTPVDLPDRRWPSQVLTRAPRWCSVDLRDGNQALIDPMNVDEKLRMFALLVDIGFVEIEVGFPSASQPDFEFIRRIIEDRMIPEGVTIQVLCQARKTLIERTVDVLEGTSSAIFHLYNSTSELQRRVVFNMDKAEIIDLAVTGTNMVREATARLTDSDLWYEYSPESFTGTELDFAIEISEAVANAWGATPDRKMIVNLPSTVEMATPNVYADQIEYFCRNFSRRDSAVISLHTHNDRGTGIAATELALMAGAERVEGTLFGNGERTGNCDIVTIAMNLVSQGVDPHLDFRDMPRIRETVENINKLPVHERHPYAGDLVFTAFSGSHQDAIKKGMDSVNAGRWEVPYLPIDPSDVGSSYKESIRVNSQSGKGGVGFVLEQHFGILLPREMLIEFSKVIQELTETLDREVKPVEIYDAFIQEYSDFQEPYQLLDYKLDKAEDDQQRCEATIRINESSTTISAVGGSPMEAFVNAMVETFNEPLSTAYHHEQSVSSDGSADKDTPTISMVAVNFAGDQSYGLGISTDAVKASFLAVIAALNRRWKRES